MSAPYDIRQYAEKNAVIMSVDCVVLTIKDGQLCVLLVKRKSEVAEGENYPFPGDWALPGGHLDRTQDKTLGDVVARNLREKTGLDPTLLHIEKVDWAGDACRNPLDWSVSLVYMGLLPYDLACIQTGGNVVDSRWEPVSEQGEVQCQLAFDHAELVAAVLKRLKDKSLYTLLPVAVVLPEFTLGELKKAYEQIIGISIQTKAFRARMLGSDKENKLSIIEKTGEKTVRGGGRAADLWRVTERARDFTFKRIIESGAN